MSTISNILSAPPDNFSTTISGNISSSALTIPLNSVTGLGTEGVGVIYQKDSDGNPVTSTIEFVHWTGVSSLNLTLTDTGDRGITGSASGAQAHSSGDTFEVWIHSAYYPTNAVTLTDTQTLTNKTLTTPKADVINEETADAGVTVDGLKIKDGRIAGWDGWSELTALTRVSDTAATLSGDWTDRLQKGDKLWWKSDGTSRYNYIIGISYSSPNTTITITAGYVSAANDSRFESGQTITEPRYSKVENSQGFPDWFSWTPSYSASGSMTYTSVTTSYAKFKIQGKMVTAVLRAIGTTGGSASNTIQFSVPVNQNSAIISATACAGGSLVFDNGANIGGVSYHSNGLINIRRYDNGVFKIGAEEAISVVSNYEMA